MAFSYSPKIVRDGLVLYLDAGNTMSYPGSGTTWTDLSRGENNGTLTNGPTFSDGSIVFDGVDDYVDLGNIPFIDNTFSIELIFKWSNFNTNTINIPFSGFYEQMEIILGGGAGVNGLIFVSTDGGYPNNGVLRVSNFVDQNINIVHAICDSTGYPKVYKSGNLIATSSSQITTNLNTPQPIKLGKRNNNTYPFKGNIYSTRVYNRALSAEEVLQNYNATKTRFGL